MNQDSQSLLNEISEVEELESKQAPLLHVHPLTIVWDNGDVVTL